MFKSHPSCSVPSDENSKIWRYIDLSKYVSLLIKKQLYFSPAIHFDDLLEGAYTKPAIIQERQFLKDIGISEDKIDDYELANSELVKVYKISCWTMREYESNLMWSSYVQSKVGVAIQSTIKRLKDAFEAEKILDIYLSKVKYIEHSKDSNLGLTDFSRILTKDKCFYDESELRGIIFDIPEKGLMEKKEVKGVFVNINPVMLIEKIVVSPYAPKDFFENVLALNLKYNIKCAVESSEIKTRK